MSGGSSESDTNESTVSPADRPPAVTVTTLTGAGNLASTLSGRRPPRRRSYAARERPYRWRHFEFPEQLLLLLERDLVQLWVVRPGASALPEQDRRHAGPHHSGAVLAALADRSFAVRVEAVTERAAPAMGQEAVLPLPPRP